MSVGGGDGDDKRPTVVMVEAASDAFEFLQSFILRNFQYFSSFLFQESMKMINDIEDMIEDYNDIEIKDDYR